MGASSDKQDTACSMIKHLVIWRLKDEAAGNDRATNSRLIKEKLKALRGQIPGLVKLEVGIDGDSNNPEQGHVVLYSVFESRVALQAYSSHPAHKVVAAFIKEVASERRVIDYEVFAAESPSRAPR